MCSLFIKFICCNKGTQDEDKVYDPTNVNVPYEDIEKAGQAIENVVDDFFESSKTVTINDKNTN